MSEWEGKCKQCGHVFISKRRDAMFCSAKCRVTANRSVTDNVTDNDLPVDVIASIERMCNENNEVQRPGHNRVDMLERARRYQDRCGKRISGGMTTSVTDTSLPGSPEYGPLPASSLVRTLAMIW